VLFLVVVFFSVVVVGTSGGAVGRSRTGVVMTSVVVVVVVVESGAIAKIRKGSARSDSPRGTRQIRQRFGPRPGMRTVPNSPAPAPTYL